MSSVDGLKLTRTAYLEDVSAAALAAIRELDIKGLRCLDSAEEDVLYDAIYEVLAEQLRAYDYARHN